MDDTKWRKWMSNVPKVGTLFSLWGKFMGEVGRRVLALGKHPACKGHLIIDSNRG